MLLSLLRLGLAHTYLPNAIDTKAVKIRHLLERGKHWIWIRILI